MLLILFLLCGCSEDVETGNGSASTSSSQEESDPFKGVRSDLSTIALTYVNVLDAQRTCASIEDLKTKMPAEDERARRHLNLIESGEIVVRWGLKYPDDFQGQFGSIVIAYERNVPTNGGWVVMDDAKTVEWTAAEFQEKLGQQAIPD